jgi:hypothetical protein
MRIRDPGWKQFGSGMEKSWTRNPDQGSGSRINIPDPQQFLYIYIYRKMPIFRTPPLISDKSGGFTAFLATEKVIDKYKILKLLN